MVLQKKIHSLSSQLLSLFYRIQTVQLIENHANITTYVQYKSHNIDPTQENRRNYGKSNLTTKVRPVRQGCRGDDISIPIPIPYPQELESFGIPMGIPIPTEPEVITL